MDAAHGNAPRGAIAVALGYTLMIAAVVAAYLGIRWYGNTLSAPAPIVAAATGATTSPSDVMLHLLLALIVVIVMARGLGTLFRFVHQPPVIGEIIAGIEGSVLDEHLSGCGVDMNDPERCRILLANHGDHALARRKEVVCGVVCPGWTYLALAFQAQQDRFVAAGRYCHLIGTHVCVGAV